MKTKRRFYKEHNQKFAVMEDTDKEQIKNRKKRKKQKHKKLAAQNKKTKREITDI